MSSLMELLGERNWWLPGWLNRMLPHIDVKEAPQPARAPLVEAAGVE